MLRTRNRILLATLLLAVLSAVLVVSAYFIFKPTQTSDLTMRIALVRIDDEFVLERCGHDPLTMMGDPNKMPEWDGVAKSNSLLHLLYCYDAAITNSEDSDQAIRLSSVSIVNVVTGKTVPYVAPSDLLGFDRTLRIPARQVRRYPICLVHPLRDASAFSPGYYRVTATFYSYQTQKNYTSDTIHILITSKDLQDYRSTHGYIK